MNRAQRVCRSLPEWSLRLLLRMPTTRGWWMAAWVELWRRAVEFELELARDDDSGPWPVAMPRGMH